MSIKWLLTIALLMQSYYVVYAPDPDPMPDPIFGDGAVIVTACAVMTTQPELAPICVPVILVASSWHIGWRVGSWIRCKLFEDRRRLQSGQQCPPCTEYGAQFDTDDIPISVNCFQDSGCSDLLVGAFNDVVTYDPQQECDSNVDCDADDLSLYYDAINEINALQTPPECVFLDADYVCDDVGSTKTWHEAKDYCQSTYGTALATISTQQQLDAVLSLIATSAWIGLNALYNRNDADFTYNVCPICPVCPIPFNGKYGQCVHDEWWFYTRPRCPHNDENGSKCVRILPNPVGLMDNDIKCDDGSKISTVCCDAP